MLNTFHRVLETKLQFTSLQCGKGVESANSGDEELCLLRMDKNLVKNSDSYTPDLIQNQKQNLQPLFDAAGY